MVQILPRNPSFGEALGRGLGGGVSQGLEEAFKLAMQQKEYQRQFSEKLGLQAAKQESDIGKIDYQERLKHQLKQQLQQEKQTYLNEILGGKSSKTGEGTEDQRSSEFDPTNISDEDIARITAQDANIGRSLQHSKDVGLREKREETKLKQKKQEILRKETLPIRSQISERADSARRGIENKEKQISLIETGNINDPTYATILEALPLKFGERFLSPETVQYKAGLVQGYGDLKNIFSGATRVKEVEILEQKIPDLYLTDQQKKAILKSSIDAQKVDILREEAAAEIEAEGKDIGVLQFRKEVEKRAKPKLDALFNKILDEQKSIIKDAENRKKIPLDPTDPEDKQIALQIMQEAGGNRTKARELAKKKGYIL